MITAFIGDNGHSREQAAKDFIDGFIKLHGLIAVDKLVGEDITLASLTEAISTSPFLSARRLVVVRDLNGNKDLAENIDKIADSVVDTTDLVIIDSHIDARGKYLTNLKKCAEVREFAHLEGDELIKWVIGQTNKSGGQIDYKTALMLIDRVGVNHQLIASELKKLVIYQPQITADTVQQLTVYSPQSSVFAMLDAAFSGDTAKALKLYDEQRAIGMEPQAILGMIVWQLHILNIVKSAGQMPASEIASKAKLSPFVVRKNQANIRRISDQKLVKLLDLTIKTDKMLKRTNVDSDDALQTLIMAF